MRRVISMSDEELMAVFKEVLQAKLPSNAAASNPEGLASQLQQQFPRISGFRLQWPWQQAPPTADSSNVSMLSKLLANVGSTTNDVAAGEHANPEAPGDSQSDGRRSSSESMRAPGVPENARLSSSTEAPQDAESERDRRPSWILQQTRQKEERMLQIGEGARDVSLVNRFTCLQPTFILRQANTTLCFLPSG